MRVRSFLVFKNVLCALPLFLSLNSYLEDWKVNFRGGGHSPRLTERACMSSFLSQEEVAENTRTSFCFLLSEVENVVSVMLSS